MVSLLWAFVGMRLKMVFNTEISHGLKIVCRMPLQITVIDLSTKI